MRLGEFTNSITNIGTIRKLVDISNGEWLLPETCAAEAVNQASFSHSVHYRQLATADDNDIEEIPDPCLLPLGWHPEVQNIQGSLFLWEICKQVLELVFHHSYKFLIFYSFKNKYQTTDIQARLISSLRSCCHEIFKSDPLFRELRDAQFKPKPHIAAIRRIRQDRIFLDSPYNAEMPYEVRKFRSPVLHKVLAALLHFFWKLDTVQSARGPDGEVNIRILAIPASFVSLTLTFILISYYQLPLIFSSSTMKSE